MDTFIYLLTLIVAVVFGHGLSIAIHELGHVVGAVITQSRIFEITIGVQPIMERWVGGTRLRFSWFPNCGYVVAVPQSVSWYRLRHLIFIALGPLFSCSYLALLLSLLEFGGKRVTAIETALLILVIFELSTVCSVLWPRHVRLAGKILATDGLQLWRTIRNPPPTVQALERQLAALEIWNLTEQGKPEQAKPWVEKLKSTLVEGISGKEQLDWANTYLGMAEWDAAKEIAERILADSALRPGDALRWEATDTFASAVLYSGNREQMPHAIGLLERAIIDFPDVITLKGTLGGLLCEAGEIDRAESTLREVFDKSPAPLDRGISAAYLSKITASRGATEDARRLADIALKEAGQMGVVKRALLKSSDSPGDSPC